MRVWLVVALLSFMALAGCTGKDDSPPGTIEPGGTPPVDPPTGTPLPPVEPTTELALLSDFNFEGCTGIRFLYLGDLAAIQGLLPEGYTASAWPALEQVPVPQLQQGQLGADMYQCSGFTAGEFSFDNVWFGRVFVSVDAPDDAAEAENHGYIVTMVAGEDVLSAIWPVAGFPSHNGTVTSGGALVIPEGDAVVPSIEAGNYGWGVTSIAPGTGAASGSFAWYHELDTGDRLTWTGDQSVPAGSGGAASLEYPNDAPFASIDPNPQPNPALSGQGSAISGASFSDMDLVRELADYRE